MTPTDPDAVVRERAAVVKLARSQALRACDLSRMKQGVVATAALMVSEVLSDLANAIERGEHLERKS